MTKKIFFASGENPKMIAAFQRAQETFPYFWRELSWEYRRIVPGLDVACVKVAFSQEMEGEEEPVVEHMWINEVEFNGEKIKGVLINEPNELTNVENGDEVEVPLAQISDWLFATRGKVYGAFTVQAMRSEMSGKERADHDDAWGLDFGDYNDILLAYEQKEHPENLEEHPMSRNMKEKLVEFIKENPGELTARDTDGNTFLHREAIAGNCSSVEALKEAGASLTETNNAGKTALDYAKEFNWEKILQLLER
jgi:uncharacterized protein YegJ (DUF2314 family)